MGKRKKPATREEAKASAAKRRKRHKKSYVLYYLLALVLVLAAGVSLSLTVFFQAEKIEVLGNSKYANGDIIDATGIKIGDNLFRINTKKIEEELVKKYPYIRSVSVKRKLPASIEIRIEQAVPSDAIEASDGFLLLEEGGRILERGLQSLPEGYARVLGVDPGDKRAGEMMPESSEEQLSMLRYVDDAIKEVGLGGVDLIDLSDRLNIRMLYDGRILIELGSELELDYKIKFAKHTIDNSIEENFIGVLDVSTRPMARVRQQDIFLPENWPFPIEILPDYSQSLTLPILPLPGLTAGVEAGNQNFTNERKQAESAANSQADAPASSA